MLRNITTRNRLVACWFAAVAVIVGSMVAMGVNVGVSTSAVLLTLSIVPPVIVLALWRSAPPTVGEVLYRANTRQEGRS